MPDSIVAIDPLPTPIVVVGDVHLSAQRPDITDAFFGWLESRRGMGGTLILLGDLFDYWVGMPRHPSSEITGVIKRLKTLADEGTRIVFQPGNRDFLLRKLDGVPLEHWPDVVSTMWGSQRVLLTHGDLLCTADVSYQRWRRFIRSRGARFTMRLIPGALLRAMAGVMRRISRRAVSRKPKVSMGINYDAARSWMDHAGAHVLVAGHVHTGVTHRLESEGHAKVVYVLKDWNPHGSVVIFDGRDISFTSSAATYR